MCDILTAFFVKRGGNEGTVVTKCLVIGSARIVVCHHAVVPWLWGHNRFRGLRFYSYWCLYVADLVPDEMLSQFPRQFQNDHSDLSKFVGT